MTEMTGSILLLDDGAYQVTLELPHGAAFMGIAFSEEDAEQMLEQAVRDYCDHH